MEFAKRKIEIADAAKLRRVPVRSVKPFALMLAPVYVLMRRNAKFVSVKAPLDFFTKEELEKFSTYESFFMPAFVDSTYPFHAAGRRVRLVLSSAPAKLAPMAVGMPSVPMAPAPYEISDAVLRIVGPLWSDGALIEPFFLVAFASGLFRAFAPENLRQARERDTVRCDHAVLVASWASFLALHLGISNLEYLERLKERVFEHVAFGRELPAELGGEAMDLVQIARRALEEPDARVMSAEFFKGAPERSAQRIASRLERVAREMIVKGSVPPSVYGEEGFAGE